MLLFAKKPIKNSLYILLFCFCTVTVSGQHHGGKGHTRRNIIHRAKLVTDKQYMQGEDSAKYSAEISLANFNTWTGDNYGYYPSIQALISVDGKKNTSYGVFGSLNFTGSNVYGGQGLFSNGIDFFFSKSFSKKLIFIADLYTYLNKRDTLSDYFSYNASVYSLLSTRLRYDFNKHFDIVAGYSLMNDKDSLVQSISLEVDYNITKKITLMVSYSTGTNIFNFTEGYFNSGIGVVFNIKKIDFSVTYNPWLNASPPSYYGIKYYSPLLISISTDLAKQFKHHKKKELNKITEDKLKN